MNLEHKYTSDGKKVVVIGNLNSQEKIVQEIFVSSGSEIPSGEHFVVKSLHDKPLVSWKEQQLKDLEQRYEKDKKMYDTDIDNLYKAYKLKSNELREKLKYVGLAFKNANEKAFETFIDYITGEIKWIVLDTYSPELLPIEKFGEIYEDRLRLISIFGGDNGDFSYARGDYYDYSGGNKKFIPFKSYEDALSKLKELILSKGANDTSIETAKKYFIEFPKEEIEKYKSSRIESINKEVSKMEDSILKYKERIEQIDKLK